MLHARLKGGASPASTREGDRRTLRRRRARALILVLGTGLTVLNVAIVLVLVATRPPAPAPGPPEEARWTQAPVRIERPAPEAMAPPEAGLSAADPRPTAPP